MNSTSSPSNGRGGRGDVVLKEKVGGLEKEGLGRGDVFHVVVEVKKKLLTSASLQFAISLLNLPLS